MGASLGVGLGLRHVLPPAQARRVVSVIGDSTFVHSGISGLVEMVYNPPVTGHVLIILDNSTTAMTGHQEHPATGRKLDHEPTHKLVLEDSSARWACPASTSSSLAPGPTSSTVCFPSASAAGNWPSSSPAGPAFSSPSNSSNTSKRAGANACHPGPMNKVHGNIVLAGLGGQGVLKGTDILADVALRAGFDVKKSEIKGMSQRGGSVTGDVRFGD